MKKTIDVSIVIPTYNVEMHIRDALDSIRLQSFSGTMEVILIDDCSTDQTVSVINQYTQDFPEFPIKLLIQEQNQRQGTARNRGIQEALGTYIFFLDSDDVLDSHGLEAMYLKAEAEQCDFVACDWTYWYEDRGLVYVNNDPFFTSSILEGENCERFLEAETYFTVNKLYRHSFLLENKIQYGEGYIYEDYEFYVDVAQKADKIAIIPNPFYHVRVNSFSTTKANRKSLIHIQSLIKAVEHTLMKFQPRKRESTYYLYKYIIKKTMNYLRYRAPRGYKRKTLKQILSLLNQHARDYVVPRKIGPIYYFYFRRKYVQRQQVNRIILVDYLQYKKKLVPLFRLGMNTKKVLLQNPFIKKLNEKRLHRKKKHLINQYQAQPIRSNVVMFLGFDYRYVGNSKYLFDYLQQHNHQDTEYYFVTTNKAIPSRYRVTPRSLRFYKLLYQSKVVVAESWVPLDFTKKEGQVWIQLWHGTPYKKLLFDSHEKHISQLNRNHKKNKQRDIAKWDWLLSDSSIGTKKLSSAFAYPTERILEYGYPRVEWLSKHQNNSLLRQTIRKELGIDDSKRVVLYVPTWRDYNYKKANVDLEYLVDTDHLSELLGEDYVIIYKGHSMDTFKRGNKHVIYPSPQIETQELILIADWIISDYSSIIFDGIAIGTPFFLYINDYEKYEQARGVYEDIHQELKPFCTDNLEHLAAVIQKNTFPTNDQADQYETIKQQMTKPPSAQSCEELNQHIQSILNSSN